MSFIQHITYYKTDKDFDFEEISCGSKMIKLELHVIRHYWITLLHGEDEILVTYNINEL